MLATAVRIEALQDIGPSPIQGLPLPANRDAADALHIVGRTLADVTDFHYKVRTGFLERCPLVEEVEMLDGSTPVPDSTRHDQDWYRIVSCFDSWNEREKMRGSVYVPGSLSGIWDGRVLVWNFFNFSQYSNLLMTTNPIRFLTRAHFGTWQSTLRCLRILLAPGKSGCASNSRSTIVCIQMNLLFPA